MYKELSDCLKKYSSSEEGLEKIKARFLSRSFVHTGQNLYGEQYEAWVYEYLLSWAVDSDDVKFFIKKVAGQVSDLSADGLQYDKNGQIIFSKSGRKVAEYDGLFCFRDKIVFVESSVSELRSYYRNLEDRLVKKRELLAEFFDTEEVYYLAVTRPKKKSLVYRSLPHLILYKLKDPDFNNLTTRVSGESALVSDPKVIDLKSISSFYPFSSS